MLTENHTDTGHLDAVVIGGSFAGLSAALQLVRARRRVLVIDSGLPRNRFSREAHGFLGHDGRSPREILGEAKAQVALYPTAEFTGGVVTFARREGNGFVLGLADGREFRAAKVILAIGVKDELPEVPGLAERWGTTVLHCPYCHGYEVRDRSLGVLAAHPMSAHQAMMIPDWGPTTYFTQGIYEPDAEQSAMLAARGVVIERTPVVELLGAAPALEGVRLEDGRVMKIEALFTAAKIVMGSEIAMQLGCEFEDGPMGPYMRVDEWKQTTVPGVYAAGDAAGAMHNVTLAAAAGVLAGVGAHQSLVRASAA